MEHKFVVAADAQPLTIEIISQMFFGMSFANAVKDIKENRGGKHDAMWNGKKAHQVYPHDEKNVPEVTTCNTKSVGTT